MIRRILIALLMLSLCAVATAEDFSTLVEALENRDEAQAIQLTDQMIERGEHSFGLYYNRGLALYSSQRFAEARAAFEQAVIYAPRDLDSRRLLREIKQELSSEVTDRDTTDTPFWSATEAATVLLLCALAIFALGVRSVFGQPTKRSTLLAVTGGFIALCLLFFVTNPAAERAVIVSDSAHLLSQPDGDGSGTIIRSGTLVAVLDHKDHFVEIELGDGARGWVRAAEVIGLIGPTTDSD